jgi:death-on-curing protein
MGGKAQLRDPALFESAIEQCRATYDGRFVYDDVFAMAASLIRSIAQNQAFVDGNKRIAWLCMRTFLAANGYDVHTTPEEAVRLMTNVANGLSIENLANWLQLSSRRRRPS